jgi:phosphoenolpyruvate carboxykinase (ATP)
MNTISLKHIGLKVKDILHNPSVSSLYEEAIRHDKGTTLSDTGALIAYSGDKTGRSPQDKRIVKNEVSEKDIWWGTVNIPLDELTFNINRERAIDYLNTRERLYCIDAYAGWDTKYRVKVRVLCARAYHALFMHNMLIRATPEELENYGEPDYTIINAGQFPANKFTSGMTSRTSIDVYFEKGEIVILGTEYAGEMKKGVFTVMNYLMPKAGILSMHCSATVSKETNESSVLFGLSGTGKTTLSADPHRELIGDDEHCWSDEGVFNIEGGCYAKAIYLSKESEPEIFSALKFGTVLENVVYDQANHHVDFNNATITQNTRGAYPIEFIQNSRIPCMAGHPKNVIFLTCDAFGVIPPVSKLTPAQAMYHFISGYTAKVAGTEMGINEPSATFSPCFGGPFLVWHPAKYAELLAQKLAQNQAQVWLVNTGWIGGAYGVGKRISLKYTRAIIDAIHQGQLISASSKIDSTFGYAVINACPHVPSEILDPRTSWPDPALYDQAAKKLANLFIENFKKYSSGASPEILAAGPKIT